MPQPKLEVDFSALDALLQFKVSADFCADYLKVSKATIYRRIKEEYDMTFSQYHSLKMEGTATKLQQKAIQMAMDGNAPMMKFALTNLAKWSDKVEERVISEISIVIDSDDEKL
jgi:hypothetical protein